jgi:hypothetical protein
MLTSLTSVACTSSIEGTYLAISTPEHSVVIYPVIAGDLITSARNILSIPAGRGREKNVPASPLATMDMNTIVCANQNGSLQFISGSVCMLDGTLYHGGRISCYAAILVLIRVLGRRQIKGHSIIGECCFARSGIHLYLYLFMSGLPRPPLCGLCWAGWEYYAYWMVAFQKAFHRRYHW